MTTTIDTDRTIAGTGAMLATAGAVGWFVLGGDSLARPGVHEYRDALFVLPLVLYAATLACIHHLQRDRAGRLERWAFRVVMVTVVLIAAANVTLVLGSEALEVLSFPLGALAWMLGMAALGAGTIRAGVFPQRVGWAIALAQPLTIALAIPLALLGWELEDRGSYTGVLVHGAVMLILAAALRDASRPGQPIRAQSTGDRTTKQATASAR
ncbi:MAG: hypothetical protein M3N04_04660 [Actinomycetota bacterium]|nr:hypothetical protein [Actinomycetota bacterium]